VFSLRYELDFFFLKKYQHRGSVEVNNRPAMLLLLDSSVSATHTHTHTHTHTSMHCSDSMAVQQHVAVLLTAG
jgi:hypothetical protein